MSRTKAQSIDDLVHRRETEAEILRAVSHLSPTDACHFLLDLVVAIRQSVEYVHGIDVEYGEASHEHSTPREEVQPAQPAPAPAQEPPVQAAELQPVDQPPRRADDRPRRNDAIVDFVRSQGVVATSAIFEHIARVMGEADLKLSKSRTGTALWVLVKRPPYRLTRSGDNIRLREGDAGAALVGAAS